MARQTTAETPDGDEPSETVPAQMSDLGQAEAIVRETHAALTTPFVAQHQINRLLTKTNPGVSSRPKSGIKRTRSEHLQDACKQWPHLVRELKVQAGKPAKFQRRMLDLGHMQSVLQGLCSTQDEILRVFGAWDDWQWEEEPSGEATWDDACEGTENKPKLCVLALPHFACLSGQANFFLSFYTFVTHQSVSQIPHHAAAEVYAVKHNWQGKK